MFQQGNLTFPYIANYHLVRMRKGSCLSLPTYSLQWWKWSIPAAPGVPGHAPSRPWHGKMSAKSEPNKPDLGHSSFYSGRLDLTQILFIWFGLGWHLARLWPVCSRSPFHMVRGPDEGVGWSSWMDGFAQKNLFKIDSDYESKLFCWSFDLSSSTTISLMCLRF